MTTEIAIKGKEFSDTEKQAIIKFTDELTAVCSKGEGFDCQYCRFHLFCYTPPKGWTSELTKSVIRFIELDEVWRMGKENRD
ncbi:MAG: hypothetical protein FWG63_03670 [Defluviitaleaceae bacterium]|nr:hypothetical protein [Defluviitaleaceae bacterium]